MWQIFNWHAHLRDRKKLPFERHSVQVDRKSTRLNSSHGYISYAVFCLKKQHTPDPDLARPVPRDGLAAARLADDYAHPLPGFRQLFYYVVLPDLVLDGPALCQ